MVQALSQRISEDGGCALIADYGHDGEKGDTFRVIIPDPLYNTVHYSMVLDIIAGLQMSFFTFFFFAIYLHCIMYIVLSL